MSTGDFGPAPPGVNLAENQNTNMPGAVIPLMIIGTGAVVLRVIARLKMRKEAPFAVDDYLILCALLFSHGTAISCFVSIPYGNGKHMQALTKQQFTSLWQVLFAYVIIYATAVTCTKASIALFYRRIFNLQYSLYFAMFFILGYWVTVFVTIWVACRPLPFFWEKYTDPAAVPNGVCIDLNKFFYGSGIAAMLIDVLILCVPMPVIWGLQMPTSQKFAVAGILLLGGFVCIASVVRINHSDDPTWSMAPVFVWSCVEPLIGIVCACLPTLGPLVRHWRQASMTRGNSSNSNSAPASTTGKMDRKKNYNYKFNSYSNLGDEIQLTNEIAAQGSVRTKGSDEEMAGIVVREEVDVTWSR